MKNTLMFSLLALMTTPVLASACRLRANGLV